MNQIQRPDYSTQNNQSNRSSVPLLGALLVTILVACVAFLAGMRAEANDIFGDAISINTDGSQVDSSEGLPDDLDYSSVERVYDELRKNFDGELNETELLDGLKSGLAKASGDPFTVYMNKTQAEQFESDLNGTFTGIGAEIGLENEILIIVAPLRGFPAEQAGLRPQDAILKIDDEDAFGLSVEEAVLKIRGEAGTNVSLTILRDGEQQVVTITRQAITIPSVEYELQDNNVGLITLSRFAEDTSRLAREAAADLLDQGATSIVLDLRNNSGGFLSAAVDVSSLWLESEVIVEQREDSGQTVTDSLRSGNSAPLKGVPTVVLINEGSASASEIVAGALQDYGVATIVGETSFGKGSVQSLENITDGGVLKVTIARWYTPNGRTIDETGIEPDVMVERTNEDFDNDLDPQLDQAKTILAR